MTKEQINRIEMFRAVQTFLDTHSTIVSQAPVLSELKNTFDELLIRIEESSADQKAAQVFLTENKMAQKRIVAEKADILNDALEAYAAINDKPNLYKKSSQTFSDLYRLRNEDYRNAIPEIISLLEENQKELTDYLVSKALINDLKNSFDKFLVLNGQPRQYRIKSVQATSSIDELLNETRELLDTKMDKLITIFKNKDANFYKGYHAARRIVN
ncbi:hypothetical protein HX109_00960 [Galbibacter sp. BG1]|uniref:hypothetical protein n=1 Tax=Galbibacter sp. BG1 TaxID=1170699 RepID=UPI0015BCBAA9|nr:hypothetical protein [Galbibacter sp. BG1]QLE00199.1 hypothetical protein HX109_00960 [Galbibacter sp. BG1]